MASVQVRRRGAPEKQTQGQPCRPAAGPGAHAQAAGDPSLVRYFGEVTDYPLLDVKAEQEISRRIVDVQIAEWAACLAHPPIAAVVAARARALYPQLGPTLVPARRAHRRWRTNRGRFGNHEQRSYVERMSALAPVLKRADQDRELLDDLEAWILRQPCDDGRGPRIRASKALGDVQDVLTKLRAEGCALRETFVTSNLRLVISVARKQPRQGLSLGDLIQEGNLGLIKAVQRFDPDTGYRFSTYAIWWIRHAITRAQADRSRTVRLPVHLVEAHKRMQRMRSRLLMQTGREPTDIELARALGISQLKLRRLQRQSTDPAYSLDREVGGDAPMRFIDSVPDEATPSPYDQVVRSSWQREMETVLEELPDIEAQIVRWRYGIDQDQELTLKQIGDRYRLSRERIRQLQQQALWRLRQGVKGLY